MEEIDPGHLRFTYTWASNTGDVAHLKDCLICERVDYPVVPFPTPFPPLTVANPTVLCAPGDANRAADGSFGMLFDDLSMPGTFRMPYFDNSFASVQKIFYTCPCAVNEATGMADPRPLLGPIVIDHEVTGRPDGLFTYTVRKSGASSSIDPLP